MEKISSKPISINGAVAYIDNTHPLSRNIRKNLTLLLKDDMLHCSTHKAFHVDTKT